MFPEIFLSNVAQIYILPVLEGQGFRSLPNDEQERVLQPLIEGAVVRVVTGISKELSSEGQKTFKDLTNRSEATPETWQNFWQKYLPNYESIVRTVLTAYQEELRTAFTA